MKHINLGQIKYDIQNGIFLDWKWHIIWFLICVFLSFNILHQALLYDYIAQPSQINWVSYILKIFLGKKELKQMPINTTFSAPKEWITVYLFYIVYICRYPKKDMEQRGYHTLLRVQSKISWWNAKCIWVILNTITFFGILIFTTILFGMVFQCDFSWEMAIHKDIWRIGIHEFSKGELFINGLLLPFLVAVSIGMLELLLTFIVSTIPAIAIVITYLIFSVYDCNAFLLGNYSMLLRNYLIIGKKGVFSIRGILLCALIIVISWIVGGYCFKKMDITLGRN